MHIQTHVQHTHTHSHATHARRHSPIYANFPHTCVQTNLLNACRIDFYLMFRRRPPTPNCERAESLSQCRWWIRMDWTQNSRTAVQHQYDAVVGVMDVVVPAAADAVAMPNRRLPLQLCALLLLMLLHLRCWWSTTAAATTTQPTSTTVMRPMRTPSPRESSMSLVALLLLLVLLWWRRCYPFQSQRRRPTSRPPSL